MYFRAIMFYGMQQLQNLPMVGQREVLYVVLDLNLRGI